MARHDQVSGHFQFDERLYQPQRVRCTRRARDSDDEWRAHPTTRSSSTKPQNNAEISALTLKKATFSRERSFGPTSECSYNSIIAVAATPTK